MGRPTEKRVKMRHVVKRHMSREFQKIGRPIEFIGNVKYARDHRALDTWAAHFRGEFNGKKLIWKKPFVITEDPITGIKEMWV